MSLENTLAVVELAGVFIEDAHADTVIETHGADALGNGMPVGASIPIDGRAHRAGNAGERLQALQAAIHGEIDQILEDSAAIGHYAVGGGQDALRDETQDDPAKPVVGYNEARPAADDDVILPACARDGQRGNEGFDAGGFGVDIGGTTQAEARVAGKRRVGENG